MSKNKIEFFYFFFSVFISTGYRDQLSHSAAYRTDARCSCVKRERDENETIAALGRVLCGHGEALLHSPIDYVRGIFRVQRHIHRHRQRLFHAAPTRLRYACHIMVSMCKKCVRNCKIDSIFFFFFEKNIFSVHTCACIITVVVWRHLPTRTTNPDTKIASAHPKKGTRMLKTWRSACNCNSE